MKEKVEAYASRCEPDFVYTEEETRDFHFEVIDLSEWTGDDGGELLVGARMRAPGDLLDEPPGVYLFTPWSRHQLLSHLGTREKWFRQVSLETQAKELNERRHTFHKRMFRAMRSHEGIRIIRGMVSSRYADIPDPTILDALCQRLPGGKYVVPLSGKTDRALYVYALTEEKITIPNTSFEAHPGVVVKNSEVGYTSLWMIPMLYLPSLGGAAVLERHEVLRKTHRGSHRDLQGKFTAALTEASGLWGDVETKLRKLRLITYPTEERALEAMTSIITRCGGPKWFAHYCRLQYQRAKHATHTGMGIFEAVVETSASRTDKNVIYDTGAVAGGVLSLLTP